MGDEQDHPAHRISRRVSDAMLARDWDALADLYSVDIVREDRRPLGLPLVQGRDARIAEQRTGVEAIELTDMRWTQIATRGDRLNLAEVAMVSAEGYEIQFLSVGRLDADGRIDLQIRFDVDDHDAAMAELDRLAARPEG